MPFFLHRFPWPLAAVLALAGPAAAQDAIRIGEVASLTGKDAAFGQSAHEGTLLAVEQLNAAGGLLGRPLELVTEDNQCKQGESATAARKLISRDKVVALLGEVASSRSLEMAPLAQAARIPMISPASTNPKVTAIGSYIFRVCFIDPFQGEVMATFARRRLGLGRAALLVDATAPYSVGLAEYFARTFTALGGVVVASQKYSGVDTDFRAQLTAIRAAKPDALFLPGYYVAAGLVARQARDLGLGATLLGGDGFEAPQLLQIGGDALNGAYYSTHFSAESTDPVSRSFVAAFTARYRTAPNGLAALTYDAVRLVADAVARAGSTDRSAVRDALAATRRFPGATGATSINPGRDADKGAAIIAVRGGALEFVESIRPEAAR